MAVPYKVTTGIILLIIGVIVIFAGLTYGLGTFTEMGAGMYPFLIGIAVALVGSLIAVLPSSDYELSHDAVDVSLKRANFVARIRPWAFIILGFVLFIVMRRYGGFLIATFSLVYFSSCADTNSKNLHRIYYAFGVTVVATIVFIFIMQMQFPLIAWG